MKLMKILDMLKNKIIYNKKTMLFLVIIVIIGILTGSFFSVILNQNDKQLVIDNITNYIENINKINNLEILKNTLLINILVIFGIWILGISVIGLFIVIILFWLLSYYYNNIHKRLIRRNFTHNKFIKWTGFACAFIKCNENVVSIACESSANF